RSPWARYMQVDPSITSTSNALIRAPREDLINLGTLGTASRRYIGPVPTPGQWTAMNVPAANLGLENRTVTGISFRLYNGKAWFDTIGVLTPGMGKLETKPGPIVAT